MVYWKHHTYLFRLSSSSTVTLSGLFFLTGIIMRKDNDEYSGGYDEYINVMMLIAAVIFF